MIIPLHIRIYFFIRQYKYMAGSVCRNNQGDHTLMYDAPQFDNFSKSHQSEPFSACKTLVDSTDKKYYMVD